MQPHRDKEREYREKKERERLAQQQHGIKPSIHPNAPHKPVPHHYHRDNKQHSRQPISGSSAPHARQEPRDILREATKDIGLRDYKRDPAKDPNREHQQVRGDKDVQKREYLLKPNVADPNNHQDARLSYSGDKQRADSLRHVDPNKVPPKYEQTRRHDDVYVKNENEIKKHLSASSARDKNNAYVNKNVHSTSQKLKTPFTPEASKSVPKQNVNLPHKLETAYNGNSSSYKSTPNLEEKIKQEVKTEIPSPPVKKPSLFSPEKSPPPKKPNLPIKTSPIKTENHNTSSSSSSSLLDSSTSNKRASSEPELRPVMKKIDQVEGYENIMRNSTVGIKIHQVPDIITPIKDSTPEKPAVQYSKEMKPPDLIPPFTPAPIVNGIETNIALISNLLKETPTVPHLPAVAATSAPPVEEKVHHHKEHKKKNKEKHKHKDKDRSKEEKEKKKKHKDKDKEKHKHKDKEKRLEEQPPAPTQPIKITIHKDKIQPVESPSLGTGLKIKIPKDRIKTDTIVEPSPSIKIKIPKEVISNYNSSENRKRERDRSSPVDAPPNKISRSGSSKYGEPKQNGRHSHNKVSNQYNNSIPHGNLRPPAFNNKNVNIRPPMYASQAPPPPNYYYYPGMQIPLPNVSVPPNMNVPPPQYMYQPYYGQGYVYAHSHEFYPHSMQGNSNLPPPLPADAPPDVPPPPPPE